MISSILPPGPEIILATKAALANVSNWRCGVAQRFPDDAARNVKAAGILEALASEAIDGLNDDLIAKVAASHGLTEATRALASRVGFSLFPANLTEFLYSVLLHVAEQQNDIERTFSKAEGA